MALRYRTGVDPNADMTKRSTFTTCSLNRRSKPKAGCRRHTRIEGDAADLQTMDTLRGGL